MSQISLDWRPNSNGQLLADRMGLIGEAAEAELERFKYYYLSNGIECQDWNARWCYWLTNMKGKSNGTNRQPFTESRRDQELRRWEQTKARLRGEGSGDNVRLFPSQSGG
jgi:hypothetical protein